MKFIVAKEIPAIIVITLFLCVSMIYLAKKIQKQDPYQKPKGLLFVALFFVETIDSFVRQNMDNDAVKNFGPYIGSLALYLFFSNISGLTGFLNPPTASFSITITVTIITWVLIERQGLKSNGIKGYIKGLFEPIPVFFVPNIFGKLSPLISLSVRLFGNILSGTIIMAIVYWATGNLTALVYNFLSLNLRFNIFGVMIAPVLHMYFDLFAGFMQMFVFTSLTMVLIQKEKE